MKNATDSGFTLIEAVVAMAVLAVAAVGFIHVAEAHIDMIALIESRVGGGWAADDALAETRLGLRPTPVPLLGRTWLTTVAVQGSDDPAISALTVTAEAGGASVTMRGFRDAGADVSVTDGVR